MKRANVFNADFEYDDDDPDGYRSAVGHVGKAAGGEATTMLRRADGDVAYYDGET